MFAPSDVPASSVDFEVPAKDLKRYDVIERLSKRMDPKNTGSDRHYVLAAYQQSYDFSDWHTRLDPLMVGKFGRGYLGYPCLNREHLRALLWCLRTTLEHMESDPAKDQIKRVFPGSNRASRRISVFRHLDEKFGADIVWVAVERVFADVVALRKLQVDQETLHSWHEDIMDLIIGPRTYSLGSIYCDSPSLSGATNCFGTEDGVTNTSDAFGRSRSDRHLEKFDPKESFNRVQSFLTLCAGSSSGAGSTPEPNERCHNALFLLNYRIHSAEQNCDLSAQEIAKTLTHRWAPSGKSSADNGATSSGELTLYAGATRLGLERMHDFESRLQCLLEYKQSTSVGSYILNPSRMRDLVEAAFLMPPSGLGLAEGGSVVFDDRYAKCVEAVIELLRASDPGFIAEGKAESSVDGSLVHKELPATLSSHSTSQLELGGASSAGCEARAVGYLNKTTGQYMTRRDVLEWLLDCIEKKESSSAKGSGDVEEMHLLSRHEKLSMLEQSSETELSAFLDAMMQHDVKKCEDFYLCEFPVLSRITRNFLEREGDQYESLTTQSTETPTVLSGSGTKPLFEDFHKLRSPQEYRAWLDHYHGNAEAAFGMLLSAIKSLSHDPCHNPNAYGDVIRSEGHSVRNGSTAPLKSSLGLENSIEFKISAIRNGILNNKQDDLLNDIDDAETLAQGKSKTLDALLGPDDEEPKISSWRERTRPDMGRETGITTHAAPAIPNVEETRQSRMVGLISIVGHPLVRVTDEMLCQIAHLYLPRNYTASPCEDKQAVAMTGSLAELKSVLLESTGDTQTPQIYDPMLAWSFPGTGELMFQTLEIKLAQQQNAQNDNDAKPAPVHNDFLINFRESFKYRSK